MMRLFALLLITLLILFNHSTERNKTLSHNYFFSTAGSDDNDGSKQHPYKTISLFNQLQLQADDTVFFEGKDTFPGNLLIQLSNTANAETRITLTSYGEGAATIDGGNLAAISITRSSYINIQHINCIGNGRKNGSTANGVFISQSNHININNTEVSGFQKAGLLILNNFFVHAENVYAHDNGFAGISVSGTDKKEDCAHIHIANCRAENNPGDPTNFGNHSGNGIIAGLCKDVLIENCTATNNGWDMPRTGNGPVGIWCYEADSVVIQHCFSFKNKTSHGGDDGGGYDLDGGTAHSVIQYCVSYDNQGSAFGIFQYNGASAWHDNIIRYCTSENDGNTSAAHANVYIWNSSHDAKQFRNFTFINNRVFNNANPAISYAGEHERSNFRFINNSFIAAGNLVNGDTTADVYTNNHWFKAAASSQQAKDSVH